MGLATGSQDWVVAPEAGTTHNTWCPRPLTLEVGRPWGEKERLQRAGLPPLSLLAFQPVLRYSQLCPASGPLHWWFSQSMSGAFWCPLLRGPYLVPTKAAPT